MGNYNLKDTQARVVTALPAQNTNANTASIDLGKGVNQRLKLKVSIPATPSLADAQTITAKVQDSDDNSSFADVSVYATTVATGAGGTGGVAVAKEYSLFDSVRRYVRLNVAASATAGNNTAVSSTVEVLG